MTSTTVAINPPAPSRAATRMRLRTLLADHPQLVERVRRIRQMGLRVKACEVHLTTTCNIRCRGCWYFAGGFDAAVPETSDTAVLAAFADSLVARGFTQATLIGGEPTLVLNRVRCFVDRLPYITVSTNGLRPLPRAGFENVAVAVSLFGGGPLDDALRAHRPNGTTFSGLFRTALSHYRDDPRVIFVYALSEDGLAYIEPTIKAIADNGNLVTFNFYSAHGSDRALRIDNEQRILAEALRVKELYPDTVVSHPYFLETLITARTHWGGRFGYEVCPSISVEHPSHVDRIRNGNPVLDGFAVYGADYRTLQFCCTSGHCSDCRDSQGVYSWLLLSMSRFLDDVGQLETWLELAESYWRQWYWARRDISCTRRPHALGQGDVDERSSY